MSCSRHSSRKSSDWQCEESLLMVGNMKWRSGCESRVNLRQDGHVPHESPLDLSPVQLMNCA